MEMIGDASALERARDIVRPMGAEPAAEQKSYGPRCYWCGSPVKDSQLQLHTDPLQPLSCGSDCPAKRRPVGEAVECVAVAGEEKSRPMALVCCMVCGKLFEMWQQGTVFTQYSNGSKQYFCSVACSNSPNETRPSP